MTVAAWGFVCLVAVCLAVAAREADAITEDLAARHEQELDRRLLAMAEQRCELALVTGYPDTATEADIDAEVLELDAFCEWMEARGA